MPHHATVIEKLARLGYVTKGLIYLLIGGLATLYAFGEGGALLTSRDAMKTMAGQRSFGVFLGWGLGIGFAGFALWRFVQAIWNPESPRKDLVQVGKRFGYAASGLLHAGFAVAAVQVVLGEGKQLSERTYVAKLLQMPGGHILAGIAALIVLGIAIFQIYMGVSARFMRELRTAEMSSREETWCRRAGRFGLISHGAVLATVGYFLWRAAGTGRSSSYRTSSGALREIATSPSGTLLLAVIAVGLVGYALHMFLNARYRSIDGRMQTA